MAELNTTEAAAVCPTVLYCPGCRHPLDSVENGYLCTGCAQSFPIIDGIPSLVDQRAPSDGFDAAAFEFLFEMERKHFWHVGRREIILDAMKRHVPGLQTMRLLELGCGNGSILAFLKQNGIAVEGGDIFLEGLRFCRQRVQSTPLYQLDALALPFSREFDIIGLFDVLEHIDDDEKALTEISRALKDRGYLMLTVPACQFLWSGHDEASHHRRRYSKPDLIARLEQSGFAVEKVSHYMFFLFPLLAAIRLIGNCGKLRSSRAMGGTPLQLRTLPIVNGVFLGLLRLEKYLLRHFDLPFGTSLMILARKTRPPTGIEYDGSFGCSPAEPFLPAR